MQPTRKIGAVLATALVASNMIGSGIFLLPATLATIGSVTLFAWFIAAVGAVSVAVVLARLGRIAPQAGGPCAYAHKALGPYIGFQSTAIYWVACWVGNIAIAIAATGYLARFLPVLVGPIPAALSTTAFIWTLTAVNIVGPRFACQVETLTIGLGLIPILLIAVAGWWYFDPAVFQASWNVSGESTFRAIPHSLVLVFWAFTGLESASVAAGVVENPRRNVPIATIAGVLIAAAVYITSCTVIMGLIPAQRLAHSTAPFADAVQVMLGPAAGSLVALMALLKSSGTLGGWILLTAQTGRAGADRGLFPPILGRVDRYGNPRAALLLMAVVMSAVVFVSMSPTLGEQFGKLIEVSTILTLLVYVYACAAAWHYPSSGRDRLIALLAAAICVTVIAESDVGLLILSVALLLSTVPLYLVIARPLLAMRPGE